MSIMNIAVCFIGGLIGMGIGNMLFHLNQSFVHVLAFAALYAVVTTALRLIMKKAGWIHE